MHLLLISINAYYLHDFIKITEVDAQIINESGIIRGTIQKVVKSETNNKQSDDNIKIVDNLLSRYSDSQILTHGHTNFIDGIKQVRDGWERIKKLIFEYRLSQDPVIKNKLIIESEICWRHANHTVGVAQINAERKHKLFSKIYLVLSIDFALIISIILIIYSIFKLKLEEQARIDPLTQIYNRHVFYEEIDIEMSSSSRHHYPLSILLIDIDFFKRVNDTYGHDMGDIILLEFASLIKSHIRKEDILCRFGGEEFVIISPFIDGIQAQEFAEKLRVAIQNFDFNPAGNITASIGVSTQNSNDTFKSLFKRVDEAVYISKDKGRNTVTYK
ncbi:MAG: GGDEF domain-containing protein [Thiovulaceae bacterium]|nr:GGDEF domain-containing protein [Sulfurimonadaceae bacterium]